MRRIFGVICLVAIANAVALAQEMQAASGEALVEGSVVNRVSGSAVKRAHVMFARVARTPGEDGSETYADTDASGHYSARLAAGQYRVWVERAGFSRLNYGATSAQGIGKVLTLAPEQELRDLSFRISPLGVISGHVLDEDGDPIQGAGVQVLKMSYATGRRTLQAVSGTSSNDRGEYRAFGLPPGRYFLLVSQPSAPLSAPAARATLIPDAQDFFAPLYYPGVLDFSEATALALGEGAEAQDVDVRLKPIRVFTIRGRFVTPVENSTDGQLQIVLAPREGDGASDINRATATIDRASGRFEFHHVAPGAYLLAAMQLYRGRPLSGRVPIEVSSAGHPEEIQLPLAAGPEVTGTVQLDGAAADALRGTRVTLTETEGLALGPEPSTQVEAGGSFRIAGVSPGMWEINVAPLPRGVWIKDIFIDERAAPNGRLEMTEAPHGSIRIVLSSDGGQVQGKVERDGQPARATVVLAPAAPELRGWSGNFLSTAADDQGNFSFSNVRPGAYKMFAFDDVEPNAWLDADFLKTVESVGQDVTVSEGGNLKQDLRVAGAAGAATP